MNKSITDKNKSVLRFRHKNAQNYFLESESYCSFDLPEYFNFAPLLLKVHTILNNKNLSSFRSTSPRDYNVNYKILNNKDGRYAWRPIQLIHPALYVSLVHQITTKENWKIIRKKFKDFATDKRIECISIPSKSLTKNPNKAEQISNWWKKIEQRSLEVALDYKYLTQTDITDCYGAIYTHSVAWALHGKEFIKKDRNRDDKSLIGNIIDTHLQDMSYGQTNGIPQGSALMDFIAEMVLGYADSELLKKIPEEITKYQILRYRDDYRIFTNNSHDGKYILKCLTEVMISLGLKLSAEKTKSSSDIITSSIKSDKLYWMGQKQIEPNPQKRLLIIHGLSKKYPNSGSLKTSLKKFSTWLKKITNFKVSIVSLISIIVDIAYNNPVTYPYFVTIVSFLLKQIPDKDQKEEILKQIICKFEDIPNTVHLLIWLQRIALGIGVEIDLDVKRDFDVKICKLIPNRNDDLWDNSWLKSGIKSQIKAGSIINQEVIDNLSEVISEEEVALFKDNYNGPS